MQTSLFSDNNTVLKRKKILAARGILIIENKILLVSQNNKEWSTPGGWIEEKESITQGATREMAEETGIPCKVSKVVWVSESLFFNKQYKQENHRIDFYCLLETNLQINDIKQIMSSWQDVDNNLIKYRKFFSQEEFEQTKNIFIPDGLKKISLTEIQNLPTIYDTNMT